MTHRKQTLLAVFVLLLFSPLFVFFAARGSAIAQPSDVQGVDPPYSLRGPHPVGIGELGLKHSEKTLQLTVWYPALEQDGLPAGIVYPYEMKMGSPFGTVKVASYPGEALRDAPFDLSNGAYPLVILSPGFSIGSSSYAWLAEHLASYGFMVISPEHVEHLDPENELWRTAITRPQDILAVFAYIDEQTGPGGTFEEVLDPARVAVVGHSYGGYTALAAAGAQIDTDSLVQHCERAQETDEPGVWLCNQLLPHLADMAGLAGLDSAPENLWHPWADRRVDAVVSLAGDAFFFGQPGLAKISLPVLAIGGTADRDSPYTWGTQPTYEYTSGPKKARVALLDAEHMIFTGPCESIPWYMKFFAGQFCADPGWDRQYAHDLVSHYTTAFLLAELKQDAAAAAALAPGAAEFPSVDYAAKGY
jgi:predicted dienelactone hydrolase